LEIRLNFVFNFLSRISFSEKLAKTGSSKGGMSAPVQRHESIAAVRLRPEIIFPFIGLWQFTLPLANQSVLQKSLTH
jgi:hypothetical protein